MSDHPESGTGAASPNPYAPPASDLRLPSQVPPPPTPILAARVAGAILLVAAPAALASANGRMAVAVIIDVVLGISLVSGSLRFRVWAIVRACLGAVLFGGQSLAAGQPVEAVFVAVYAGVFPLLLIGTPGKGRTIAGGVIGGVVVAMTYIGLLVK
jgi:hypothetical protein